MCVSVESEFILFQDAVSDLGLFCTYFKQLVQCVGKSTVVVTERLIKLHNTTLQ